MSYFLTRDIASRIKQRTNKRCRLRACQKRFTKKVPHQVYCSDACRYASKRATSRGTGVRLRMVSAPRREETMPEIRARLLRERVG